MKPTTQYLLEQWDLVPCLPDEQAYCRAWQNILERASEKVGAAVVAEAIRENEKLRGLNLCFGPMTLELALHILTSVHTRKDDDCGYAVLVGAKYEEPSHYTHSQYNEAWRTARKHIGLQVDPTAPSRVNDGLKQPG